MLLILYALYIIFLKTLDLPSDEGVLSRRYTVLCCVSQASKPPEICQISGCLGSFFTSTEIVRAQK